MKAELIVDADIAGKKRIFIKKFTAAYFNHPFHFHQFCELTWIQKGHGKLIIGDYTGDFAEGELILQGTGLPHLWKCDPLFYKKKATTQAICIYFPAELLESITDEDSIVAAGKQLLDKAQRGLRITGQTKTIIISLLQQTAASDGLKQLACFLQIIDLLIKTNEYELLASVIYKNTNNISDMDRFNNVYQFLLNNFTHDIMLEEVAGICNLTPSAFCRYFKSKTQKTFSRFLNEIRIGHACALLQHDTVAIKNIGYECGYNNPVNFFKSFKAITGMTPMEYRETVYSRYSIQ